MNSALIPKSIDNRNIKLLNKEKQLKNTVMKDYWYTMSINGMINIVIYYLNIRYLVDKTKNSKSEHLSEQMFNSLK